MVNKIYDYDNRRFIKNKDEIKNNEIIIFKNTFLKDFNNRFIYEGDVLFFRNNKSNLTTIGYVSFENDNFVVNFFYTLKRFISNEQTLLECLISDKQITVVKLENILED